MKFQKLIRSSSAFLNGILILVSIFSLFAGHAGVAAIIGGSSLLNCFLAFKAPDTKHPGLTKAISLLSILGNLCLIFVGAVVLHLDRGHATLFGGSWLILTAVSGFYYAARHWRTGSPETDESFVPQQQSEIPKMQHVYQNITTQIPRSELKLDRKKLIFIDASIICVCITIGYGLYKFILKDHSSLESQGLYWASVIGFSIIFCGIDFVRRSISLIRNPPLIRLFANGIEIGNLGFWAWDEFGGTRKRNTLIFALKRNNKGLPLTAEKTGATFYKCDEEQNIAIAKYEFPFGCSKVSLEEFNKALCRYAPSSPVKTVRMRESSLPLKTWKTFIFGSEKPTRKTIIGTLGFYSLLGLCFYAMAKPTFFPSEKWESLGNWLISVPVVISFVFLLRIFRKQGFKTCIKNGKKQSPLLMLFIPLIVWVFFKIGFVLGLGHSYTAIYGDQTSIVVPVEKTKVTHSSRYSTQETYCVKSDKLNMGFMSEICLSKDRFDSVPENFIMTLVGKQSYFGFVYDRYGLHDPGKARTEEGAGSTLGQAEYDLARRYATGNELPKNYLESAKHLSVAAEEGNADAQRQLGLIYMKGIGVNNDPAQAERWMRAAAEQGDAGAQFLMAGLVAKKGKEHAQEIHVWLRKAAEQGVVEAQAALGLFYLVQDHSVKPDPAEASKWLRLAADKGDVKATEALATLYMKGDGVSLDLPEAAKLFQKAAEQGSEEAQLMSGLLYAAGRGVQKNVSDAEKWFRRAAEKGNAEAQYLLGGLYAQGEGVAQDYAEAAKWWRLSAEQGKAEAQNNLAYAYEKGYGITQDFAESMKWCRKAADQGLPIAISGMGDFYRLGEGVPQNYAEAEKWYRRAAEYGSPEGQFHLGQFYASGTGIPRNYEEAYFWLTLSASAGSKDASVVRDEVAGHLTGDQISSIQKRANDWKPVKFQPPGPSEAGVP